ncbi:MAG: cyclic nucleotide-binding domain-containing protein [Candidatus Latescibacteria bacterium]|jgi:CRP/FNR family transcriptional regulator, cyclic AMP receptor protein|nr:cyclic nucleotide-binding domain-containing protein [Candidatus Latescibacterota bacterium]MBT5829508.1 cyclic nucleotide-binding domain-containing protein [Candidatus Latescibacterota bacterium]
MNQQQQRLAQIIQKINVFNGLNISDIQQLLHVCKMRSFAVEEQVYKANDPSDEMLILLKGQLVVSSASGEPLGSVTAGQPIGEMGVFTGQNRSATVTAMTECGGVAIRKMDVEILMARNPNMYVKVLKNIVGILCDRLGKSNTQNEQHMKTIMRMRDLMEKRGATEDGEDDEDES